MHSNIAEPEAAETPSQADEAMFRTSWRDELLGRCWERLKEDERRSGKPCFTVLRFKVDNPDLRSADLAEALSKKLGKPINAGAIRVALHRARDLFADILLDDVIASLESDSLDEAEQELIDLELHEYCRPALDKRRDQPK